MLESRLADLDSRYRIERLPVREREMSEDPGGDSFEGLTTESQFEALLTLRLHIIEATGLDDLDEDTTVLEALRGQALAASGEAREQLRHACAFELAVGRFLGAEALRCTEPKTRMIRTSRMHEAFAAACKAFSQFAELAAELDTDVLEVGLCSIDG
ncbi:hypothetical protein ACNOYE_31910 [Nannocystaceae bacterium ST9]